MRKKVPPGRADSSRAGAVEARPSGWSGVVAQISSHHVLGAGPSAATLDFPLTSSVTILRTVIQAPPLVRPAPTGPLSKLVLPFTVTRSDGTRAAVTGRA